MSKELREICDELDKHLEILKNPNMDEETKNISKWELGAIGVDFERISHQMVKDFCKMFKITKKKIVEYMNEDEDEDETPTENKVATTKTTNEQTPVDTSVTITDGKDESSSEESSDEEEVKPKKATKKKPALKKGGKKTTK